MLLQITDDNYVDFLAGWQLENKPSVLMFDQVPHVPLIYKVGHLSTLTAQVRCNWLETNVFFIYLVVASLSPNASFRSKALVSPTP